MTYTPKQTKDFSDHLAMWRRREMRLSGTLLTRSFIHSSTKEFVKHGVARRLQFLDHCIRETFSAIPPDSDNPSTTQILNATCFLQTFIFNVFGAIDNIARVWCMEARVCMPDGKPLPNNRIGLTSKYSTVRKSLFSNMNKALEKSDEWFSYLENYRHALAHRIPLYVPPRVLDDHGVSEFRRLDNEMTEAAAKHDMEEWTKLFHEAQIIGKFVPIATHSYEENAKPIRFHPQMICDFGTVIELGESLLLDLDRLDMHNSKN